MPKSSNLWTLIPFEEFSFIRSAIFIIACNSRHKWKGSLLPKGGFVAQLVLIITPQIAYLSYTVLISCNHSNWEWEPDSSIQSTKGIDSISTKPNNLNWYSCHLHLSLTGTNTAASAQFLGCFDFCFVRETIC